MLSYYLRVVRSVTEYACQAWHSGLTKAQTDKLELIQIRALAIIYPKLSYSEALNVNNLPSLHDRRTDMCKSFFTAMQKDNHKLNYLLPKPQTKRLLRGRAKMSTLN